MLAVMACDSPVCGFRFEGLAVGRDEDGCHEAEGAEALGYNVGLNVAVIICFRQLLEG